MVARDDPKFQQAAAYTAVAFDLIRHLLRGESHRVEATIDALHEEHGWEAVMTIMRALALATLDISGLRRLLPMIRTALQGDTSGLVASLFTVRDVLAGHREADPDETGDLLAGLRFLVLAAEASIKEMTEEFHRQYLDDHALRTTISGVLALVNMAVARLPEPLRDKLANFVPDADYIAARADPGQFRYQDAPP